MICTVRRSRLRGTIAPPPSKTYTHRAVFAASLAGGTSTVRNALISRDTQATIGAARAFGAQIEQDGTTLRISGAPSPHSASIDAQNSGTTIRIAAAVASLAAGTTTLTGDSSLRTRPVGALLDSLESMGARCSSEGGRPPFSVSGPVAGGRVTVDGSVSSQFVSALLLAAPCTREGVEISIAGEAVSLPYIDATVEAMRRFGADVSVKERYREYAVAPRPYAPAQFSVPSDYSTLALLLAASVLTGDGLEIRAEDGGLPQGDAAFVDHLESMGVQVNAADGLIRTKSPRTLEGGRFELTNTPDLLPPLAVLALKCGGDLDITGIAHARKKETDRIAILAGQLRRLGLAAEEGPDSLLLRRGGAEPGGARLDASGDHRIFMALCIACMYAGGSVEGAESAAVSYPDFVDDMRRLGAQIETA